MGTTCNLSVNIALAHTSAQFWLRQKVKYTLSNGPDKKERSKRNERVGMHKGANFTAVY